MKVARIIIIVFSLVGMFLCLVALLTENRFLGLLGSLDAVLITVFQLCRALIEKKRRK